jgi:hypothetical protein
MLNQRRRIQQMRVQKRREEVSKKEKKSTLTPFGR